MNRTFKPAFDHLEDRLVMSTTAILGAAGDVPDLPAFAGQTVRIAIEAADASSTTLEAEPRSALTAATDENAVVFVGGWGASSYQYGFSGTYANGCLEPNLAASDVWSNDPLGTGEPVPSSQDINDLYIFRGPDAATPGAGLTESVDAVEVREHEIGHALGIHHTESPSAPEPGVATKGQTTLQNVPTEDTLDHAVTVLAWARVDGASGL